MILLTRARLLAETQNAAEATVTEQSLTIVPRRRSLHSTRYDLLLLAPAGLNPDMIRRVATLFGAGGLVVGALTVASDADSESPLVELSAIDAVARIRDSRALLLVHVESERVDGEWLAWVLGAAEALQVRCARLPIAKKDQWKKPETFRPPVTPPARRLPYLGVAHAVGEAAETFWVIPPGEPLEYRDAVNLDHWLRMRPGQLPT